MEKKYNILWFDDEHEKMIPFKMQAHQNGIELAPFASAEEGIEELLKNYPFYDGVLMDARFFVNKTDQADDEDLAALMKARDAILSLSSKKKFDVFVLTGQVSLFDDRIFKELIPTYYRKGVAEDINRLFEKLKESADNHVDTMIRHKHQRVFEVCTEMYLGELAGVELLGILKNQEDFDVKKYLNPIRKIVEDVFITLNKFELLPDAFVKPHVSLNESSKFLKGEEEKGMKLNEDAVVPQVIASNLRSILWHTQAGSHRSFIDDDINALRTPYLLNSLTCQLLDVIVWLKMYIDSNPTPGNWTSKEEDIVDDDSSGLSEMPGTVINKNDFKGFAFLEPAMGDENIFIPPHLVDRHNLSNGNEITIEIEEYEDRRTGETKTRAKRII